MSAASGPRGARPRTIRLLRIGAAVALLALLAASADPRTTLAAAGGADPAGVLSGLSLLVAVHALGALTWRSVVRILGGPALGVGEALGAWYAGQAVGTLTPGNVGADAYRAAIARRSGVDWSDAMAGVLIVRATSVAACAALAAPAVVVLPGPGGAGVLAGASLLTAASAAAVGLLLRRRTAMLPRAALARSIAVGLAGGLAFHLVATAASWILFMAVEPAAASPVAIAAVAVSRLALLVPLTPAGIGIQEGLIMALCAAAGLDPAAALATALLGRAGLLVTAVVGTVAMSAARRASPAAT